MSASANPYRKHDDAHECAVEIDIGRGRVNGNSRLG
jgi:hypothetical protein